MVMVFAPVTLTQIANIELKLEAATGVIISGSGPWTLDGEGIEADLSYSAPTLTVTINKKPFFVSMNHIKEAIQEAIQEALN